MDGERDGSYIGIKSREARDEETDADRKAQREKESNREKPHMPMNVVGEPVRCLHFGKPIFTSYYTTDATIVFFD